MLTSREYKILEFLIEHLKTGVSPSYDEICAGTHLKAKSNVARTMKALEVKGYIKRIPYRARAIEVVRFPLKYDPKDVTAMHRLSELEAENLWLKSKLIAYGEQL